MSDVAHRSGGVAFRALHKVATYALATTGLAALVLSGELGNVLPMLIGAGVIASWFAEGPLLDRPAWSRAWNAAAIALFGVAVARAIWAGTVLTPAIELAAFLQLNRLFNRRTGRDYALITVLAASQLVAATVLDTDLSYAACFVAFVILGPPTMVLGHLRREIERNYETNRPDGRAELARILRSRRIVAPGFLAGVAALSVPVFVMTAAVFLFFPRIGFGLLVSSPRYGAPVIGFSDSLSLGGFGVLRDDPSVVLRVQPDPPIESPPTLLPIYLRGTAFDRYDGQSWHRTSQRPHFLRGEPDEYRLRRFRRDGDARLRVWMDALDPPIVFTTPDTISVTIPPRLDAGVRRYRVLSRGAEDEVRHLDADDLGLAYVLNLDRVPTPLRRPADAPEDVARYLEAPPLAPRVRALLDRWVAGATDPAEIIRRVAIRLRREYRYSRELPGDSEDPLADFLLRRKAGHCEYFSTALAVLLRTQGVPTRNVTGFHGATWNRYGGYYAVRQSNAHSWVEVWLPGRGWMTVDPTPPGSEADAPSGAWDALVDLWDAVRQRWQRWVIEYDLGRQIALLRGTWRLFGAETTTERGVRAERSRARPQTKWVGLAIGVVLLLGVLVVVRRRAKGTAGPKHPVPTEVSLYRSLDRALERVGRARPPSRTPEAHARSLSDAGFSHRELVRDVTDAYLAARFAGRSLPADRARALRSAVGRLR